MGVFDGLKTMGADDVANVPGLAEQQGRDREILRFAAHLYRTLGLFPELALSTAIQHLQPMREAEQHYPRLVCLEIALRAIADENGGPVGDSGIAETSGEQKGFPWDR